MPPLMMTPMRRPVMASPRVRMAARPVAPEGSTRIFIRWRWKRAASTISLSSNADDLDAGPAQGGKGELAETGEKAIGHGLWVDYLRLEFAALE